ncbi:MAG: four helix bundle suffix domain-containing protein [Planctomycetota bacterium]|jgi:four helix bundle suffix protein
MQQRKPLIPKRGGYRNLKSFQIAQLIYDITVRFCERYIDKFSRTRDQMVQAARSGVQNIAEGSLASATSKKTELKLTNVARASQEELRLDYEDFLRQRNLPELEPDDPILKRFKARRCTTLAEVQDWIAEERQRTDGHGPAQTNTDIEHVAVSESPCQSLSSAALAANAALSLINLGSYLLDKQIDTLAKAFENEGGFTERMYRVRRQKRKW